MRTKAIGFAMAVLFAFGASGQRTTQQSQNQVFYFAHTETALNEQEIASAVRSITDIQASFDAAQRALAVRGTPDQIALAEWLFSELDQPAQQPPENSTANEYRLPGNGEVVVRVFYCANVATPQDLQEIATVIRSITGTRRLFTYNAQRALVLRGTDDQIAVAEWLFNELDKPAGPAHQHFTDEYRSPTAGDDVTRVFCFAHAETPRDFQEVATLIRAIGEIPRVFTYNALRAVAVRGTAGQIAMANWLFNELDQQRSAAQQISSPSPHEFQASGGSDDLLRVYYLAHTATAQDLQRIASEVRTATGIRRLHAYDRQRALALRGTAGQIAAAERVIQDLDKPASVAAH